MVDSRGSSAATLSLDLLSPAPRSDRVCSTVQSVSNELMLQDSGRHETVERGTLKRNKHVEHSFLTPHTRAANPENRTRLSCLSRDLSLSSDLPAPQDVEQ